EEGLQDKITLLKQDYRLLEGQYDKLVSIEMIEAVGHQFLDTYTATISRLLKDDGIALLQAITIDDQRYEQAKTEVDFIKRYIFPGSFIPCVTAISQSFARASDMKMIHLEDITPHYARTLAAWRERFLHNQEKIKALGYDDTFIRLRDFYFAYCDGGFAERVIGDVQVIFAKPQNRREPLLGAMEEPRQMLALPINVAGFQLCCIAGVVGGNSWAVPVCAAFFVWHWQVLKNGEPMLLAAFAITGVLFDTALYKAGLLSFPGHSAALIPLWLMLLWLAFACTLRHSLDWLLRKPWLAVL